ncbi:hypothetical protein D3C71_25780 [compost metagenome]
MEQKSTERAQRRHHDAVAIRRQVRIAKAHNSATEVLKSQELGRFRKHHAMDCGNTNCGLCSSSRRNPNVSGLGRLTRQERVQVLSFDSELNDALAPAAAAGE